MIALTVPVVVTESASAEVSAPRTPFGWATITEQDFGRYTVGPCAGEAPLACVRRGDRHVGLVEHFAAPTSSFDILAGVKDPGRAIRRVARDFLISFRADRTTACPELRFRPIRPQSANVAGDAGLRWGFELIDRGVVVERTLDFGVVQDGVIHILVANATSSGACVPPDVGFGVRALKRFEGAYARLAAVSDFTDSFVPIPQLDAAAEGSRPS